MTHVTKIDWYIFYFEVEKNLIGWEWFIDNIKPYNIDQFKLRRFCNWTPEIATRRL